MRNAKKCKENTFLLIALFSTIRKEKITFFHTTLPQMYAPNPYCAYIPCSIIIETRPEEGMQQRNQSFFVYCVEIEFRHRSLDRQVDSSLSIRSDAIRQWSPDHPDTGNEIVLYVYFFCVLLLVECGIS